MVLAFRRKTKRPFKKLKLDFNMKVKLSKRRKKKITETSDRTLVTLRRKQFRLRWSRLRRCKCPELERQTDQSNDGNERQRVFTTATESA